MVLFDDTCWYCSWCNVEYRSNHTQTGSWNTNILRLLFPSIASPVSILGACQRKSKAFYYTAVCLCVPGNKKKKSGTHRCLCFFLPNVTFSVPRLLTTRPAAATTTTTFLVATSVAAPPTQRHPASKAMCGGGGGCSSWCSCCSCCSCSCSC